LWKEPDIESAGNAPEKQHRLTAEWLVARSGERASEYHGLIAGDVLNRRL